MQNSSDHLHTYPSADQATWELSNIGYLYSRDIEKQDTINNSLSNKDEINVKVPAEEGQTALHVAVKKGHLEMVRLLLEGGANVNKADFRGCTPKSLAKQQENKQEERTQNRIYRTRNNKQYINRPVLTNNKQGPQLFHLIRRTYFLVLKQFWQSSWRNS